MAIKQLKSSNLNGRMVLMLKKKSTHENRDRNNLLKFFAATIREQYCLVKSYAASEAYFHCYIVKISINVSLTYAQE